MSIYDELQQVTRGIMGEFRQEQVEYVRMVPGTGGTPDASAASTTQTTPLDAAVQGVAKKYVDRGLALASDRQVTSSVNLSISPNMRDFINVNGERHKIEHFEPIPSAGVPVAWVFIIRR